MNRHVRQGIEREGGGRGGGGDFHKIRRSVLGLNRFKIRCWALTNVDGSKGYEQNNDVVDEENETSSAKCIDHFRF